MNIETRIFSFFVVLLFAACLALLWQIRDDLHAIRQSAAQDEQVKPSVEFRPHRQLEVEITSL